MYILKQLIVKKIGIGKNMLWLNWLGEIFKFVSSYSILNLMHSHNCVGWESALKISCTFYNTYVL